MNAFLLSLMLACGGGEATPDKAQDETEEHAADHAEEAEEAGEAEKSDARVFFVAPEDGATVKSPLKMTFGVEGMEVKPAGELVEGTGHHHVIVDKGVIAEGTAVPKDAQHIHYGKGQTEAELELEPGEHTLTLQFANGNHESYGEAMSQTIKVTVEK